MRALLEVEAIRHEHFCIMERLVVVVGGGRHRGVGVVRARIW